jgi:hydrogenase-4 component B
MTSLLYGAALILAAGVAQLLFWRRPRLADPLFAALLLAGSALSASGAIASLWSGATAVATLPGSLPGGAWVFGLDSLSAWFLLLVLLVGAPAGIFGLGYLAPERHHRPVPAAHALFAVLLLALVGVVTARAMVPLLVAWEAMALSGYLLIMFEHEQAPVRRAGFVYLVLTHVSTLALLLMFAVLSVHAGGRTFEAFTSGNHLDEATRAVALSLALVGFGIKAGAVPLHFWLPGAHAAAPSHVSAVLSGLMLKMGIYGLLRMVCLLGTPPAWLGWTLFVVGLLSGILGVLWALSEQDLKRVLAYSSVENIGIIMIGVGVGSLGLAYRQPAVALLGFTAALLHALNHALFKSLLFLGAGSVLRATGTRLLDELGGLGRELPWTAVAFGVGSAAIVGLPPLNGFVGEWVAVQGLLEGARRPGPLAPLVLGVAGLGLIGALALVCFSRVVGSVFLGRARRHRTPVHDTPGLVGPLLALAGGCVVIGVVPIVAVHPAVAVSAAIMLESGAVPTDTVMPLSGAAAGLGIAWLLLIGVGALLWIARRRAGSRTSPATGETWGCAYPGATPRMQYTASSFSTPLVLAFGNVAAPAVERDATSFRTHPRDRVLAGVVRPLWRRAQAVAAAFRPLQQGPITRYLQYIVLTLLLLLGALFVSIVRQP